MSRLDPIETIATLVDHRAKSRASTAPVRLLVGIGGGVAVGKSTFATQLADTLNELGRLSAVVALDGWLLPNAELDRLGLGHLKGHPETWDWPGIETLVDDLRSGRVVLPRRYDHTFYDVDPEPGPPITPDVEIAVVEGLPALFPSPDGGSRPTERWDLALGLDAGVDAERGWYTDRLLEILAAPPPGSFYASLGPLGPTDALAFADAVWDGINGPLRERHVEPGLASADLVVTKSSDHDIASLDFTRRRTAT